jgi:N6-adenosine-specific RNA methylase IME4
MSAENFGSDDLGNPRFLDRRDEAPGHVCAQCHGWTDGLEEAHRHGDSLIWLNPECKRFWLREHPADHASQEERPVELIKYDRACRAIADAKLADEVKDIRDRAIAIKAYARQAKNKTLEADAWEIRQRAERRLGEMMREQPKAPPGRPIETGEYSTKEIGLSENPISYASAGIDKNLAHRARTLAAMPTEDFTVFVDEGREQVQRSVERAVMATEVRKAKHQAIAEKADLTLACLGPFPLIYADPPWKWGHFGEQAKENEAGKGRTSDQHYPTLTYDEIKDFTLGGKPVSEVAHKDAALFLWCTSANIELALGVMRAWGFEYKAHAVWVKDKLGLGFVFRNKHEVLLYGTRGNMPAPQIQPPSVFEYPRGEHSAKPAEIREIIERMYPDFSARNRLELFARDKAKNWTSYGFEVPGTDEVALGDESGNVFHGDEAPNESLAIADDLSIPACLRRSP